MNLAHSVRSMLAALALLGAAGVAAAQETPAPTEVQRGATLVQARKRWEGLTPAERDGLLRRYEKWNRLPAEQREDLRRRFDDMGGREGAAVVRRSLEELRRDSPEQIRRMRIQAAVLDRLWERFAADLPPRVAERLAGLKPEARERVRRGVCRAFVTAGRVAVVRKYATETERAAIEGTDAEARRSALASMKTRLREAVLAPRRDELEKLEAGERRAREVGLLEEHFWECAREGLRERLPSIREAMEKSLQDGPERGPRRGQEWFKREFGVSQDDLGVRWVARPLMIALRMQKSPEARAAFLESLRPELARIAALPAAEREAPLRALLEKIR